MGSFESDWANGKVLQRGENENGAGLRIQLRKIKYCTSGQTWPESRALQLLLACHSPCLIGTCYMSLNSPLTFSAGLGSDELEFANPPYLPSMQSAVRNLGLSAVQ